MDTCESCGVEILDHAGCLSLCMKIESIKLWISEKIEQESNHISECTSLKCINTPGYLMADGALQALNELKEFLTT